MYNLNEKLKKLADDKGISVDEYINDLIDHHLMSIEYGESTRRLIKQNEAMIIKHIEEDPSVLPLYRLMFHEDMMNEFVRRFVKRYGIPSKTTHQIDEVQP